MRAWSLATFGAFLPFMSASALIGCNGTGQHEVSAASAPTAAPASGIVAPIPFKPIDYFEENCSRCHGPYGSFYGNGFGRNLTDAALRQAIDHMAAGPGNAPLAAPQLDVQTAYHRSLIDQRPFVIVNAIDRNDDRVTMFGEVSPDTIVFVGPDRANVKGHAWDVVLPPTVEPARVVISVVGKTGSTKLSLAESPHSHARPTAADKGAERATARDQGAERAAARDQ